MWMPGVGNSRRQIVVTRGAPHLGNIEIGLSEVAAQVAQDILEMPLRIGMVDKPRLEFTENLGILLHRHLVLCQLWIMGSEGILDHRTSKFDER